MLDMSGAVILPVVETFGRPVVFTPLASQPGEPSYPGRGSYSSGSVDVMTEGNVVFSDNRTSLLIRLAEFAIPPIAQDRVFIPAHLTAPEVGEFMIQDVDDTGTGGARLQLKRVVP